MSAPVLKFMACAAVLFVALHVRPVQAAQAMPATLVNSVGMTFALIPSGSFVMGSDWATDESPRHKVDITALYLGTCEVTQEQWQAVMGFNPYDLPRTRDSWAPLLAEPGRFVAPQKPATVSWNDAQTFIRRLNEREGHTRYRLPTEAEWEYAARAGSTAAYAFGDDAAQLGRFAWHGEDFVTGSTHPVGQKLPNAWGLYDVHGNVWEWVSDWYDADYYQRSPAADPEGPAHGSRRVVRGGSWHASATSWRVAFRRSYVPDYRGIGIGFRLVLTPETPSSTVY